MSRFYYLNPYFAGRTGVFTQFSLWLRPKYNNYGAKVDLPAFYLLSRVHCLTLPRRRRGVFAVVMAELLRLRRGKKTLPAF